VAQLALEVVGGDGQHADELVGGAPGLAGDGEAAGGRSGHGECTGGEGGGPGLLSTLASTKSCDAHRRSVSGDIAAGDAQGGCTGCTGGFDAWPAPELQPSRISIVDGHGERMTDAMLQWGRLPKE